MPEPLGGGRRALVGLAAALATRDEEALEGALRTAAEVADPREVDEVLLQSHLFVGFPVALEALMRWREMHGGTVPEALPESCDEWAQRGARVCEAVYADNYPKLRRNVAQIHPDFDRWMVEGGYGRVLGRPGLDLATRELCVAALLAVWNAPRQLHSHLRGALNAGAGVAEVDAAVELACRYLREPEAQRARALWARVRERWTGRGADN